MTKSLSTLRRADLHKPALIASAAFLGLVGGVSGASAQCAATGAIAGNGPVSIVSGATSAAASALVSSLNTMNTSFLSQGTAFVSAPSVSAPSVLGGGVWVRGVGGQINTQNASNMAIGVTPPGGGVAVPSGNVACSSDVRQTFSGFQVGQDLSTLNVNGWNIHSGVTAGYGASRSRERFSGTSIDVEAPFAGIYAAATHNSGFFIDGQLRWDFQNIDVTSNLIGLNNKNINGRAMTFTSSAGYNVALGDGYFVEPSAGVVWSRNNVDVLQNLNTQVFPIPGGLRLNTIESVLGRAGVRVGRNITTEQFAWQPFVVASVWHEFARPVTGSYESNATILLAANSEIVGALNTSRVGTYGQFAVGLAGQLLNTGWLGYARVDYRVGNNIDGYSVNGGLRYQFDPNTLAQVVSGARYLKAVKAPVARAPAVSWTGFYLGGHAGALWGRQQHNDYNGVDIWDIRHDVYGALAGGQAGYNYQVGSWVFGIEGDASYTNARGGKPCLGLGVFRATCTTHLDWVATATGRVGYSWQQVLAYVKGGAAWQEGYLENVTNIGDISNRTPTQVKSGWTIGTGIEFALTQNWSAKAEYNYLRFDPRRVTFANTEFTDVSQDIHLAKVGVNYRFSSALPR